ncbi:MAG: alpha/beta hydrolase [Candidatus Shapirobacteria bacterium]|nr:alpha/beta hydrolase [Candidatus Shapirobacteria bacterium]
MKKNINTNLVFLHGWGGCWQSWFPILENLKKNYSVYAPDLPGFGQNPIHKPYNLNNYVDFVCKYLKDNNIKDPILIGHSFGGAIISKIAAEKTISIKKIILVDAAPIRLPQTPKQKIITTISKPAKSILSLPFFNKFYHPIKKILYRSLKLQDSGYADLENPVLKKTFTTVIRQDLSPILPKINIPTLIIWGENDTDTPLSAGKKIHSLIPNSHLIIYPKSSHFAYLENKDQFIKDIKTFINK